MEAPSKQLKQKKKKGKGNKSNVAEALTDVEENTVWLFNSVHFGLRGCEEHRQMTWGDAQLHMEADRPKYLEYCERKTKTRTGAEPGNVRAVKPKAFAARKRSN